MTDQGKYDALYGQGDSAVPITATTVTTSTGNDRIRLNQFPYYQASHMWMSWDTLWGEKPRAARSRVRKDKAFYQSCRDADEADGMAPQYRTRVPDDWDVNEADND